MFAVFDAVRKPFHRLALLATVLLLAACDAGIPVVGGNSGQRIDPGAAVPVALLVPLELRLAGAAHRDLMSDRAAAPALPPRS